MMSVQELKRAMTQLEPEQLEEFMIWAADYHFKQWDAQIEADLETGRFDKLLDDVRNGFTRVVARD